MEKCSEVKILNGEDLRRVRLLYKLQQKEMAKYFGIPRGTYACWESRYKNKLLPINKYKEEFEAIEYWTPKHFQEAVEKISMWDIMKEVIKRLMGWIRK